MRKKKVEPINNPEIPTSSNNNHNNDNINQEEPEQDITKILLSNFDNI